MSSINELKTRLEKEISKLQAQLNNLQFLSSGSMHSMDTLGKIKSVLGKIEAATTALEHLSGAQNAPTLTNLRPESPLEKIMIIYLLGLI